jgi:3-oxosteroid 1-dehydrogenase
MSVKENKKGLSRRDFTKAAMVGISSAVGMGAVSMTGPGPTEATGAETKINWHKEADVVILGAGCAGITAALAAQDAGAKVLVLEVQSIPGGTSRVSGGAVWIPNNPVMKQADLPDSREEALAYCRLLAQGQADDDLIITFVDKSLVMLDFIIKTAPLKWFDIGYPDYHPEWAGGKRRGRSISPGAYKGKMLGAALMAGLYDAAKEHGCEFMFNSRGKKLITNSKGGVIGLQAYSGVQWVNSDYSGGTLVNIRAKKGVILASGGFEWNQELARHLLRGPQPFTGTLPLGQGDALKMSLAVGADVRNLNECWGLPMYVVPGWEEEVKGFKPEQYPMWRLPNSSAWEKLICDWFIWRGKPGVITVNKYGRRFCNEGADYDTTYRAFITFENFGATGYPNIPGYVILDSTAWNKYGMAGVKPGSAPPAWIKKADSLRELAQTLKIDPDGLEKTVSSFNLQAKEGKDPEFHRGESYFDRAISGDKTIARKNPEDPKAALAPLETPPFYGLETWPGSCGTCGGPRVNSQAQVLNSFGEIIPGLYAAGNAAGVGAPGASYGGGGGTIGPGMTFGYIAGLHAAKRKAG